MAANSRFAVATHTVLVLAHAGDNYVTSQRIAESVNTNAVVIRRLLGVLTKARICESHPGRLGGSKLARRPDEITLFEVYRAVDDGSFWGLHDRPENKDCPVSCGVKNALRHVFADCESSVARSLDQVTVRDLLKTVCS